MHFSIAALFVVSICLQSFTAARVVVEKAVMSGSHAGRHIVLLKTGVDMKTFLKDENITSSREWDFINAFSGNLSEEQFNKLFARDEVQSISEDGIVKTSSTNRNELVEPSYV